jgi:hypothetical protein
MANLCMIWGEKEREVFIVKSNLLCLLALYKECKF